LSPIRRHYQGNQALTGGDAMSAAPLLALVRRLQPDADAVLDAELLDRFTLRHDQAAFELLVWRHGALVWGVCRRMLAPDWHAAEDACQATFVALARHAARVRAKHAVAGWLHRVAVRASLDLLSGRATRPLPGADQEPADSHPGPASMAADRELGQLLDAAVNRLPDRLRMPFLLCELEGRSNADAAALLRCAVGTVESRLSRARVRLRKWLAARGASPAVAVPESVQTVMIRAAVPGAVGPAVRALAERAVRLTLMAKLLVTAAALGGLLAVAAAGLALAGSAGPPPAAVTPKQSETKAAQAPRTDAEGFALPAGVVARLGSARLRHAGWAHDVCFSPDGKLIASVGGDRAVRVWDGTTGQQVLVVRRQDGQFDRVAFTQDGKALVAVGHDRGKSGDLWRVDRATGTVTARFALSIAQPDRAALRFTRDGARLAVGTSDTKQLMVIDTTTGGTAWTVDLGKETPGGTAFAADGKTIAVTTDGGTVRLFDATGKPAGVLTAARANLKTVALSSDGKKVAAYDRASSKLLAWDRSSGKLLWRQQHLGEQSLAFSPDGRTVARTSSGFAASVVEMADGWKGKWFSSIVGATASAFRGDGKVVAFGTPSGTICLFDPATGQGVEPSADPPHEVRWLRFSPDGKTLYGWASDWFAWTVPAGQQRQVTRAGWNYGVPLSPDGKWTARSVWYSGLIPAGSKDDGTRFEVCDAATGAIKYSHSGKSFQGMSWTDFTPDGKAIVAAMYNGTVRSWALDTGKELFRLSGVGAISQYHAFSPDGRVLVVGCYGDAAEKFPVRVYDLAARKEVGKFHPGAWVVSVAVSADGRRVATATSANTGGKPDVREVAVVWDVASGKELARVPQHGEGGGVALSPDGRTVAVATHWKGEVRVWEVASGAQRFFFRHAGQITGLAFSPDGRTLAIASKEAPVYLWDVAGDLAGPAPSWGAAGAARVWGDLASTDAGKAFTAMRRLRAHPADAVPLLRTRTKLPAAPDAGTLKRLFADLDTTEFRTREKATAALAGHGETIRGALEAERGRTKSAEARARLTRLLARLSAATPDQVRLVRAVEAVESMTTAQARALLEAWASGTSGVTLAAEARAALARRR
jgi:RNA polymerase sigma factor (sigma-70 family)